MCMLFVENVPALPYQVVLFDTGLFVKAGRFTAKRPHMQGYADVIRAVCASLQRSHTCSVC